MTEKNMSKDDALKQSDITLHIIDESQLNKLKESWKNLLLDKICSKNESITLDDYKQLYQTALNH